MGALTDSIGARSLRCNTISRQTMSIKLEFELTDRDLDFFRSALKNCRDVVGCADESDIIDGVRSVIDEIRANEPLPDFVASRLPQLDSMIQMLLDEEWALPAADREHLLSAFVYFGDPEDILPDNVPVIGYLDDVIIVELVAGELEHARIAYEEFCAFRESFDSDNPQTDPAIRRDRLDKQRQQLHQRMHQRAAKDKRSGRLR